MSCSPNWEKAALARFVCSQYCVAAVPICLFCTVSFSTHWKVCTDSGPRHREISWVPFQSLHLSMLRITYNHSLSRDGQDCFIS